jgi:phosphatidate cytidylyltransferase
MDSVVWTRIKYGTAMLATLCGLLALDAWLERSACFGVIVTAAVIFGTREFCSLAQRAGMALASARMTATGGLLIAFAALAHELDWSWWSVDAVELPIAMAMFFLLVFPALAREPSMAGFQAICASLFGFVYIWGLARYILALRHLEDVGLSAAFYCILIAKGTDIFAYFTGRAFGRRKLIPHISPGKTVAGFVGGMSGALAITAGFVLWTPLGTILPWFYALPFAIVIGLVVVAGDLVESLIKRSFATKDSANLLPAFGGVLDVIDSILAAAPFVYYGLELSRRFSSGD